MERLLLVCEHVVQLFLRFGRVDHVLLYRAKEVVLC